MDRNKEKCYKKYAAITYTGYNNSEKFNKYNRII